MNVLLVTEFDSGNGLDFQVETLTESGGGFSTTYSNISGCPESLQRWVLDLVNKNSVTLVTDEVLGLLAIPIEDYWSELARHCQRNLVTI